MRPIRSWLYAPGNNAKLLDRVFTAGADAVILDLEDAVPAAEKERARAMVAETVASRAGQAGPAVFVRINHPATDWADDEIRAVVRPGLDGLRVPKIEDAVDIERLAHAITEAEAVGGMLVGTVKIVVGIESALGLWRADAIAAASDRVLALNLGVADLVKDLGITQTDGSELLYARSRLVLASRVAGIAPPVDSVTTAIDDLDRLERECRAGRNQGFFGKSAIHPKQVETINRVYTPTETEVAYAVEVVTAARQAEADGSGAVKLPNGDFVDAPIVARAEALLALAAAIGVSSPTL